MVESWGVAIFLIGLAVTAVELAYPRRYVGVLGIVTTVVGLTAMFVPDEVALRTRILVMTAAAFATLAIAIPFYRRYAPHVGPMTVPMVGAGDLAIAIEPITPDKEGLVRAGGVAWTARADEPIAKGATVRILVVEGERLWVEAELATSTSDGDDDQRGRSEHER